MKGDSVSSIVQAEGVIVSPETFLTGPAMAEVTDDGTLLGKLFTLLPECRFTAEANMDGDVTIMTDKPWDPEDLSPVEDEPVIMAIDTSASLEGEVTAWASDPRG